MDLKKAIRVFPDFPRPGILFRDITPVLKDAELLNHTLSLLEAELAGVDFDLVISPESRGFLFGVPISARMGKGFIPARKKGKLPGRTMSKNYFLEYGLDTIEIHTDAIKPGQKAVIVDDLLATGGTARCICDIVAELGGEVVRSVFLIELDGLGGREALKDTETRSILTY